MTFTSKISSQKATALAKKVGAKVPADGKEIGVTGGVLLKEGGTYYFTETPKGPQTEAEVLAIVKQIDQIEDNPPENPPAGDTVSDETDNEQRVRAAREKTAEMRRQIRASIAAGPRFVKMGSERPMFRAGNRRIKSKLHKRIIRRKNQGKVLSEREIRLLTYNAAAAVQVAAPFKGLRV